jgi:endonuclease III
MEQLLRGILGTFASESRAEAALGKLHAAVVDLNELRVTPIAEIVGIIGVDYPHCRRAAEEISRGLQSVFYHLHGLDLSFLKASSRKAAEAFLNSLDGVGPHARATVIMRCLQGHAVPLDVHMHDYLRRNAYIPEGASVEDAQKRLTRAIRECDAGSFYVLLKRYAGARAPRKPEARKVPASGAVAAKTGTKAKPKPKAKTSPGKPAPKKKTARRKPTSIKTKRKTASTTAGRARKAPAEKPRKKAKKVAAPKKEATSTKKRAVGKRPRRAHKAFASRSR